MPGFKLQEITGFKCLDRTINKIWLWHEKTQLGCTKTAIICQCICCVIKKFKPHPMRCSICISWCKRVYTI